MQTPLSLHSPQAAHKVGCTVQHTGHRHSILAHNVKHLLEEIQPDADFENCDTLIDDGILDSFAILSIVSELQDTYDITITPADIIPENFNSAKALWDMVCRLKG